MKKNQKMSRLIYYLCIFALLVTGFPFPAKAAGAASTEITGLYVGFGAWQNGYDHNLSVIGPAKEVYDHIYYVSRPTEDDFVAVNDHIKIMGSLQSDTAEVSVKELADPDNLSGRNLEVTKGGGYKLDVSGNKVPMDSADHSFTTRMGFDDGEANAMLSGVFGTAAYEISVTDGGKTETYYLLLSRTALAHRPKNGVYNTTEGYENPLQDITLTGKDGTPLTDSLQYAKGITTASENRGVCGIPERAVIPDDIKSIRLKLTRGEYAHWDRETNPAPASVYEDTREDYKRKDPTYKDRELFYRENDYTIGVNGGPIRNIPGNGLSEEIVLKQGFNIIQIVTKSKESRSEPWFPSRERHYGSYTLLLYREGANDYRKTLGDDTSLKSVRIYAAHNPDADKSVPSDYQEWLNVTDLKEDTAVTLPTNRPHVFILAEAKDPEATVSVPGAEPYQGGFLLKLDHNKDKNITISVTPANGQTSNENAGLHSIAINWERSGGALKGLQAEGGSLTEEFSESKTDYYLVPDSMDQPVRLTYTDDGEANTKVSVHLNQEGASAEALEGKTVEINPKRHHQAVFEVTGTGGVKNLYYVAVKRERASDEDYKATKDRAQVLADRMYKTFEETNGDQYNGAYWDTFAATAVDSSANGKNLDGKYLYDVTKHGLGQATDEAAIILELVMAGENPFDFNGVNYVEKLRARKDVKTGSYGPYACNIWALYALDAAGVYDEQLVRTVAGQANSEGFDLDMRGWALAAIQNHLDVSGVKEKSDRAIESFKKTQGNNAKTQNSPGCFENSFHRNSNMSSHACVMMGLAAAGVNTEEGDWKTGDMWSPLETIEKRIQPDNTLVGWDWLTDKPEYTFNSQVLIALGDVIHRDNVWTRQILTTAKVDRLLTEAAKHTGDARLGAKIQAKYNELKAARDKNGDSALGLGELYYALYDLVGLANPDWKPDTFMGTKEEKAEVEAVAKQIDELEALDANSPEMMQKTAAAREAYDSLYRERKAGAGKSALLQHYIANLDILEAAEAKVGDDAAVTDAINAINALPDAASLAIEPSVAAAEAKYSALNDQQKKAVTNIGKLQNLRSGIDSIKNVQSMIAALPAIDQLTLNDLQAVTQAQDAFDRLGSLKAEVPNSETLTGLLARLQDLQAADDVTKKIAEIGDLTEDNWKEKEQAVQEADAMFKRLTEGQRTLVMGVDLLEAAKRFIEEQKLAEADKDVAEAILRIRKLRDGEGDAAGPLTLTEKNDNKPTPEIWTEEWISQVKATRSLINALTPEKVSRITNLADQERAEECVRAVETERVRAMIEALPDPAAAAAYGEEPTEGKAPLEDAQIAAIRAAKEAFDALERKDLLNDQALEAKLSELYEKAQTYPYWDEARLQPYVDELTKAYSQCKAQPLDRATLAKAQELTAKYDGLTDGEKAVLQGMSGGEGEGAASVPDMLAFLSEEIARVQKDIEDAAQADQYIEDALSAEVSEANAEAIRADVASIEESLSRMSEAAKSYMNGLEKLRTAKSALEAFDKAAFTGGRPAMKEARAAGSAITVKWEAYNGAAGYRLFRRTAGGQWGRLADVRGTSYKDESVRAGVTYYYAVKAISERWPGEVSGQEAVGAKAATLGRPSLKKAVSAGYRSVKLAWAKAAGANGYEVYRAAGKNGEYKKVGETTALSFTDKGLKTGTAYRYKVRGYNTVSQTKAYGDYSVAKSVKPVPSQAKIARAAGARRAVKLTWKKVDGASGYTVYRAASKNGKYKAIKTLKGAKRLTYTDAKRKKGKGYYYKIRAYRAVGGKKVYGPYSAAKGARAK